MYAGLVSYRAYWTDIVLHELELHKSSEISIQKMSERTAVSVYDIIRSLLCYQRLFSHPVDCSTLQSLGLIKYWRGKHVIINREELFEEYQMRQAANKHRTTIG